MNALSSLKIANHHPDGDSIQGSGLMYQGIFSRDSLSTGLPADFLAGEFLLRLSDEERLTVLMEAFILAGIHGNDDVASVLLDNFQMFLRHNEHYFSRAGMFGRADYKDSYDKSCAIGTRLFEGMRDAYWRFPLYDWGTGNGHRLVQVNRMQKTKKQIFLLAAQLWGGVDDNLGERAFWFLCDVCSAETVVKKAFLFAAETARRKKNSYPETRPGFYFEMPKEDVDAVLNAMRTYAPDGNRSEDKDNIRVWLRKMTKCQPDAIRRHLGHAYVNAGGLIE
ncbi:MAG: hypothetical protein NUV88_01520 [Candidatus Kaiserbacteria bacterium]|nr:hypothetical protein [Candidatus Kaiserbacteria bacterium]